MKKRIATSAPDTRRLVLAGSALLIAAAAGWSHAATPDMRAASTTAVPLTRFHVFVAPSGNDGNPGTAEAPFATIARASRAAVPDTTVHVAPGAYEGSFRTTASGSPGARIYYVSTTRFGAVIVPPAKSSSKHAWDNRGSHVDIVGFRIDGSQPRGGTRWTVGLYNGGSHGAIRGNWVHHILFKGHCNSGGGSAIGVDSYFGGVQSSVIGNLVHDIGPAGCRYVQGIYMSTSGQVLNNVVYRVAEGAIHLWHDARDIVIANNTVANSNTGIIVGGGDYYRTSGPADNIMVYSNIVYDNKMGISEQGSTGRGNVYQNNLVFQNTTYDWRLKNGLTHSATVSSDPLLAGYSRVGQPDLSPSRSSPAIGRGSASHAPAYDHRDQPRNVATGFDIGAYQHF